MAKIILFLLISKLIFKLYIRVMKVQLWSLGKDHESYVQEGIAQFQQRLSHYCDFEIRLLQLPKKARNEAPSETLRAEAQLVLSQLPQNDWLIALDERGKQLDSPGWARMLQQQQLSSTRRTIFLIGGAYGLDDSIRERSNQLLGLSQLTFPHQLVRLIVCEQLYRAFSILRNEKYHHQ